MDTDTAMTIVEAIAELNRRAERIHELKAENQRLRKIIDWLLEQGLTEDAVTRITKEMEGE